MGTDLRRALFMGLVGAVFRGLAAGGNRVVGHGLGARGESGGGEGESSETSVESGHPANVPEVGPGHRVPHKAATSSQYTMNSFDV